MADWMRDNSLGTKAAERSSQSEEILTHDDLSDEDLQRLQESMSDQLIMEELRSNLEATRFAIMKAISQNIGSVR